MIIVPFKHCSLELKLEGSDTVMKGWLHTSEVAIEALLEVSLWSQLYLPPTTLWSK